jgi:hypothetical protein
MKSSIALVAAFAAVLVLSCFAGGPVPSLAQVQVQTATPPTVAWVKERGELMGRVDGLNKVYILAKTPDDKTELGVFLNGLYQTENADYTLVFRTVTFVQAPRPGDAVRFWYRGKL